MNINESIDDYYDTGIVDAVQTMPDGPVKTHLIATVLDFLTQLTMLPGVSIGNHQRIQGSIYEIHAIGNGGRHSPAPAAGGRRKMRNTRKTRKTTRRKRT